LEFIVYQFMFVGPSTLYHTIMALKKPLFDLLSPIVEHQVLFTLEPTALYIICHVCHALEK
jgi:hypothetical protein